MIRASLFLSLFVLMPSGAAAKDTQESTFLGCSFGAPDGAASSDTNTQKLYLLYRVDDGRNETVSVIDTNRLLGATTLKYRKTSAIEGGELWTFAGSATEPTGTILLVLPKKIALESGREARAAALGQYHGSGLRNGACVIVHGEEATTAFEELGAGNMVK